MTNQTPTQQMEQLQKILETPELLRKCVAQIKQLYLHKIIIYEHHRDIKVTLKNSATKQLLEKILELYLGYDRLPTSRLSDEVILNEMVDTISDVDTYKSLIWFAPEVEANIKSSDTITILEATRRAQLAFYTDLFSIVLETI